MMTWTGSIALHDDTLLHDFHLIPPGNDIAASAWVPEKASLKFLSIVETARIPLRISLGPPWRVATSAEATERWFEQIFATVPADAGEDGSPWWQSAKLDSDLGVIVAVGTGVEKEETGPRVTELLLYASRSDSGQERERLPTPPASSPDLDVGSEGKEARLTVHALPLCSDLLNFSAAAEPTPPASPTAAREDVEAVFLPHLFRTVTGAREEGEPINRPPVRKRRSAAAAFDEADSRRKKARQKDDEGIIAATAPKSESQLPSLKHRRSVSNTAPVPLQTRPLSRSPSVASSRPTTAAGPGRRSTLSQVYDTEAMQATATETKNKDFISRIVMAGMRLHGLSQSKSRGKTQHPDTADPARDEERKKADEEFKLIYHQMYKGTCFAFRTHVGVQSLQPFAEQVREVVEKILGIFCNDPLAAGLGGDGGDEVTPGGRKAFGSVREGARGEEASPFLAVSRIDGGGVEKERTPSTRRREEG